MCYTTSGDKMKEIKLVAFDIDGTLVARGQQTVSEKTKIAIEKLKAKNIKVLVATGRIPTLIQDSIHKVLAPDFYVTINGQLVVDKNFDIVTHRPLDANEVQHLINYSRKHQINMGLKWEKGMRVVTNFNEFAKVYVEHDHDKLKYLSDHTQNDKFDLRHIYGVFFIGSVDKVLALQPQLKTLVLSHAFDESYELFDPTVSKSRGIEDTLSHYNLTWENVISFGDAHNDIDMLKKSKIGIAMGNATEEVKSIADYTTLSVEEDGVYTTLKQLKLI